MKMKMTLGLLSVLVFALAPTLASGHENETDETTRPGWYAGVAGTWAIHLFEQELEDAFFNLASASDSAGLAVKVGYRFNKWFAGEFMYEWIDGFEVTGPLKVKLFDIVGHGFTVNGKAYYPIKNWHPYFLGGIGLFYTDIQDRTGTGLFVSDSETAFAGRVGAGVDLYINRNWVITLETTVLLTTTNLSSPSRKGLSGLHYVSQQLGVMYRF